MEGPGAYRAETTNSTGNKRTHKKNKVCVVVALPALPQIVALPAEEALIFVCILPAVPHYQAALCSSSGERQLWIPLLVSEAILHLLLAAAEKTQHLHNSGIMFKQLRTS